MARYILAYFTLENHFFHQIRDELQKKKVDAEFKPVSVEDDLEVPMTPEDHVMSLRYKIHQLVAGVTDIAVEGEEEERFLGENEMPKPLNELLSQETHGKYEEILANFRKIATEGKLVDVDSEEIGQEVEAWIRQLTAEIKTKMGVDAGEFSLEELEAQCWMLFEAMARVINTETMEKSVNTFYEEKEQKSLPDKEKEKLKAQCVEELVKKYSLSKVEAEILVDLVKSGEKGEEYSLKILVETVARLWKEYQVGDQRKVISKIAIGSLTGQVANSSAPAMMEGVMGENGNFNLAVFLEYLGLNQLASLFEVGSEVEAAKLAKAINEKINQKITNSLFFQEFEFIQGQSLGKIYSTLEKGKVASQQLLTEAISQLLPMIVGIAMSLAFLTKIYPALGAIGLASLPVMYQSAKRSNQKIWAIYESEVAGDEAIATNLGTIKQALEEVRTSQDVVAVKEHTRKLLDKRDVFTADKQIEMAKARFKQILPFDLGQAAAAITGWILQQMGKISGGAVLANTFYSERLNVPIHRLVKLYFGAFARYVQDIKRMEEVLGKYESLDLPEGEKEKERIPVGELPNLDISIKGIDFKGILSGLNLEVRQGEFVTIVGGSGEGKSTLLRVLAGLYKPQKGAVEIGGTELPKIKKHGPDSIYSKMAYCNQSPQIFDELSLRENLVLWSKTEISDEKIIEVMRKLNLDKFVGRLGERVQNLSGGERVRIGLARTLIKGAQILLLDEPTASLDSSSGREVRKIIANIKAEYPDVTIICVTHDEKLMRRSERRLNIAELQGKEVLDSGEDSV